jgi:hypothetical protein
VATFDLVAYAIDHDRAMALFDAKELIMGRMGFHADVLTGVQGHQDKLQVFAGVKNLPEGSVFLGQRFDIGKIALHGDVLSFACMGSTLLPYAQASRGWSG